MGAPEPAQRRDHGATWCWLLVVMVGVATALSQWTSAGPASGAPISTSSTSDPTYYLALGDSLATGTDAPPGAGYVADLFAHYQATIPGLQLVNYGCPGETTTSFINGPSCGDPGGSQLEAAEAFLRAHPGQVALVTIDIGGNDVVHCASTSPTFSIDVGCVTDGLAAIQTNLTQIMAGLRSAGGPVPIYAMNYYDPFVIAWLEGAGGQVAAQDSVTLLSRLNGELAAIYEHAGASLVDVASAFAASDLSDLVSTPSWGTVPVSVANACTWLAVTCAIGGPEGFGIHANASGYQVIANTFEDAIGSLALPAPAPAAAPAPAPSPPSAASAPTVPPAAAVPAGAPLAPAPLPGAPTTPGPSSGAPGATSTQGALANTGAPLETTVVLGLALLLVGMVMGLPMARQRRRRTHRR